LRVCLLAIVPPAVPGRLQLVLLPGEADPGDLAGRGSRQRLAQLDDVRHYIARQPLPTVVQHVLAGEVARAVRGDDRPEAAAEQLIRHRQHRRRPDGRVPVQRGFHLAQLHR